MIYLDTCIISGLVRNDIPRDDLQALEFILSEFEADKLNIVTSEITRTELNKIPDQYRSPHVSIYNSLVKVPLARTFEHTSRMTLLGVGGTKIDPLYLALKKVLPDENDVLHLFQASKNGATYFITVDRRTILKYSSKIHESCGLVTTNPSAWLTDLRDINKNSGRATTPNSALPASPDRGSFS